MELRIFNTLSRRVEPFQPLRPGKVGLYTCGPTVYHYAHIGNLRTYVFEDLLVRALRASGYEVNHVMNITDVGHLVSDRDDGEDKMEVGARRAGKSIWEIAEYYTKIFFSDLEKLNVLKPNLIPKATDHIPEMIAIVDQLDRKGFVYRTTDGLYFDTSRFPTYRNFARLDLENLEAGKRVAVGEKRSPSDFALWKFSPENEKRQMEWDSPWGRGFPGWHIECSAMAMKYLGETFDMHCGGIDHIPVHHTNEIAQSEAATGKQFVRYWLHGEFLNEDSGKMSKSKGETLTLSLLEREGFSPLDYRFLLLQAHYRSTVKFSWDGLRAAQTGRKGLLEKIREWKRQGQPAAVLGESAKEFQRKFQEAWAHDLNLPEALAHLFSLLKQNSISSEEKLRVLFDADEILGLGLANDSVREVVLPEEVVALMAKRDMARKAKQWQESDRLRDELVALGYKVLDTAQGTKVES
jgi:cysteinyl-tRNA synthetase